MKFSGKFINLGLIITVLFLTVLLSCTHTTDVATIKDKICFNTQVLPILQTNCAMSGCHEPKGRVARILFADYPSVMKTVTPRDLKNSKLYTAITASWSNVMPPSPYKVLSQEQRTIIAVWIQQGAKSDSTCK